MPSLSSMRCVVLGGGGFIGTNLCRRLKGRVDYLRAFGRRQSFPEGLKGIEWFAGDFHEGSSVASAVEGCDTVFHLINSTTPASANLDKYADVQANILGSLRLLEACRAAGVKRVVFVSSGGTVYGIPRVLPTPEEAETWPITGYAISKLAVERYLRLYEYLHRLDYRILRVSNPFGPYQVATKGQGVVAAFLKRALAGQPLELWGDGAVRRDFIYIDDVVLSLELAALHDGTERVFNIGSGVGHSLNDIVGAIGRLLDTQLPVQHREGRAVDIPVSFLDISRAKEHLEWIPEVSLEEGLRRTIQWMRQLS
jgi:UDP-glucose 4-epimerase